MSQKNKKATAELGSVAAPVQESAAAVSAAAEKNSKVVTSKDKVAFFQPLIESGKYTAKELLEMAQTAFPKMTESTIRTFLTDSKNPKYNKFPKLVALTEDKKMIFVQEAA